MSSNLANELEAVQKAIQIELKNQDKLSTKILHVLRLSSDNERAKRLSALNTKRDLLLVEVKKELTEIEKIHAEADSKDDYIFRIDEERILEKIDGYERLLKVLKENRLFDDNFIRKEIDSAYRCKNTIRAHNPNYIKRKKSEYAKLFQLHFPLDEEQKQAVITDDKYNLVIAGAGAGKTEVLINRIIYLTNKRPAINPDRILAIAFQKKLSVTLSYTNVFSRKRRL